ncbi:MAG: hypothetical protein GY851_30185, partial [bacterium]|nr:hypothetical protein [bacterium]
ALSAAFAGAGAYRLLRNATRPDLSTVRRLALSALAVGVVVMAAEHGSKEARRVFTVDEMRDARELSAFARDFEPGAPIATTYWPVVKLLNFTAPRNVPLLKPDPSLFDGYRAIIVHGRSQKDLVDGSMPTIEIGRYAVLINSE